MRTFITTLLLLFAIGCFANSQESNETLLAKDSTVADNDTTWNAQAVMEAMTSWFLKANFGKVTSMTRDPQNMEAQSAIHFPSDAPVAGMMLSGIKQKFPTIVFTHDTTDMGSPHREYLYEYGGHIYKVEFTLEKTGHDSAIVHVDVKADINNK